MIKIPKYFNKVANKYWSSNPKSQRNETSEMDSRMSRRSGMHKSHSRLPMIRSTGQGKYNYQYEYLGIKSTPQVKTMITEIRNDQNSWQKNIQVKNR